MKPGFQFAKKLLPGNEEGAVLIEFGLMLPLMVILMLFLMICYELVETQIGLQVEVYAALRRECASINSVGGYHGRPRKVTVTRNKSVFIRGKMASIIGVSHVPFTVTISSYAGVHPVIGGISQYYKPFGDRYFWP